MSKNPRMDSVFSVLAAKMTNVKVAARNGSIPARNHGIFHRQNHLLGGL